MNLSTRFITPLLLAAMLSACAVRAPVVNGGPTYSTPRPAAGVGVQYGVVSAIDTVYASQATTGSGALIGGVIGAVVGRQFGHGGHARAAGTMAGAAGGIIIGNEIERQQTGARAHVRVSVQLENGQLSTFNYANAGSLRVGDRVRIENNLLVLM